MSDILRGHLQVTTGNSWSTLIVMAILGTHIDVTEIMDVLMVEIKKRIGFVLMPVVGLTLVLVLINKNTIPQDPSYHHFSDVHSLWDIPNAWNVLSNLPFLFVGLLGLYKLLLTDHLTIESQNKIAYVLLYLGVALVAVGSGYYHLWPNNSTLLWDRLPMTIAFMSLFSIVVTEFISIKAGKIILLPLVLLGLFSVIYWHVTETDGAGDLRFYILVQFFPMLAIPIILLTFSSRFTHTSAYGWLIFAYFVAKLFEHFDAQIHEILVVISGHSLKHITAAIGLYVLLRSYEKRKSV